MLQTPLYQSHIESGGRMVEFAGWAMPVVYTSIAEEHKWTRRNIGMFDVSHMGRIELSGPGAIGTVNYLCTQQMIDLPVNQTRYSLMCNKDGGILDDLMVTRFGNEKFFIVCNASNREKIVAHIKNNMVPATTLYDHTPESAMIAIQGPQTIELISRLIPGPLEQLLHRGAYSGDMMGIKYLAFRGGYTGEDGFEVVFPANIAPMVWEQLLSVDVDGVKPVKPVGLGARDTLRLEASLPLYGHELTEKIDPITARLSFAINMEKDFIGKEALEKIRHDGISHIRVGLKLETKRAAREGYEIFHDEQKCGYITSGAFTPTLKQSIAMGYVEKNLAVVGNKLDVRIGKQNYPAEIVKMPFYRRKKG